MVRSDHPGGTDVAVLGFPSSSFLRFTSRCRDNQLGRRQGRTLCVIPSPYSCALDDKAGEIAARAGHRDSKMTFSNYRNPKVKNADGSQSGPAAQAPENIVAIA